MEKMTETFSENIDKVCDKIIERKKISKVIRLSHEEIVMIRFAINYTINSIVEFKAINVEKIRRALGIIVAKVYRYE